MWILWVGVLLCSSSYSMAVPFLPLFLLDLGVTEKSVNLWAGVVHSSAFLVGALMAPLWGALADKYGKRKMVIRAGLSLAIIYGLVALVQTPWQLVGVRMLHGLVGGFVPASMAIVASLAPKEKLSWSLGIMQAGSMSGGIVGPLFGGVLATWFGQRMSFVAAAILILLAALAVIIWVREGEGAVAKPKGSMIQGIRDAFHKKQLVYLLGLLLAFQLAINMILPLLTLHIVNLEGTKEGAVLSSGFVFALIGIAGIIAAPLWGRAGEKQGYIRILSICLLAAGSVVSLQFFVDNLPLFIVVQTIYGLFVAGIVPMINTLVVSNTDEQFRGRSFGLTTSANQMGAMIGPLLGGALGFALDIHWIFVSTGLCLFVAGLFVLSRGRKLI